MYQTRRHRVVAFKVMALRCVALQSKGLAPTTRRRRLKNEKTIYPQTALGLAVRQRPVRTMRQEPGGNYNPAGKFSRLHRLRSQARHCFTAAAAGHNHDRHKNFRQARH